MKIVYIVTVPITAKAFLVGHLSYLREHGHEVILITSPDPLLDQVGAQEGVTVIGVPMQREISPLADAKSLWQLWRVLRDIKPDAVTAGTPKAGLLGMIASWLLGVPLRTYVLHGLRLETLHGLRRRIMTFTEHICVACAHKVVCVSQSLRQKYIDEGFADASKTLVLASGSASGVIAERHLPRSLDQNWLVLRQQLGIPADALVIGFVGRFVRDKGIGELVAAFQAIRKRHLQCCLLLIGTFETGDPLDVAVVQYLQAALANSAQSGVYGTGWVADVAPYYPVMDVLALPTYREGFPISPLEASMCEVPVVGTLATGMVDAVVNGKTGLLVSIGDVTALTNALLQVLENVELRQQLGMAGRQRTLASFLPNQIWQAWCDYYLALCTSNN